MSHTRLIPPPRVPGPLCVDLFYNRTGRRVCADEILFVGAFNSADLHTLTPETAHLCSDVRVRLQTEAADACVVEAEVLLPHALQWKLARGGG